MLEFRNRCGSPNVTFPHDRHPAIGMPTSRFCETGMLAVIESGATITLEDENLRPVLGLQASAAAGVRLNGLIAERFPNRPRFAPEE